MFRELPFLECRCENRSLEGGAQFGGSFSSRSTPICSYGADTSGAIGPRLYGFKGRPKVRQHLKAQQAIAMQLQVTRSHFIFCTP